MSEHKTEKQLREDAAADVKALIEKLDEVHIFDTAEVEKIRSAIAFTEAFHGDPEALLRVERLMEAASGFITVTNRIGLVIAFVVLLVTQWERLLSLAASWGKP